MADKLSNDEIPDLSHLREQVERVLRRFMPQWNKLTEAWQDDLIEQVEQAIMNDDFAALTRLVPDSSAAQHALYEQLRDISDWSSANTAAEIEDDEDAPDGVTPRTPPSGQLLALAGVTAGLLAIEMGISAARAVVRNNGSGQTRDEILENVRKYLGDLSSAGAEAQIGGSLHGTLNAARQLTFAAAPTGSIYASELNDANTCKPCAAVNGRFLGTVEQMSQVLRSYPQGAYGGYIGCLGGPRCRGTIFGVWRSKQTEGS